MQHCCQSLGFAQSLTIFYHEYANYGVLTIFIQYGSIEFNTLTKILGFLDQVLGFVTEVVGSTDTVSKRFLPTID